MSDAYVIELTEDEIVEIIDKGARERLGIMAKGLIDCWKDDQIDDPGGIKDLVAFASLLPHEHPLHVCGRRDCGMRRRPND